EVATGRGLRRRRHRFLADVVLAELEDPRAAFGTWAQRLLAAEVDHLAGLGRVGFVAEVEFQLPVLVLVAVLQRDLGRERPARLGAEALQRADLLVAQELLHLVQLESTPGRDLGERETAGVLARATATRARIAAVVLPHDA